MIRRLLLYAASALFVFSFVENRSEFGRKPAPGKTVAPKAERVTGLLQVPAPRA